MVRAGILPHRTFPRKRKSPAEQNAPYRVEQVLQAYYPGK
jgi:hypothetical protein